MIREFGEHAAGVARAEHANATGEAASSWDRIASLIERKIAKRRLHDERAGHAVMMADAAASPEIRALHLELARLHKAMARSA